MSASKGSGVASDERTKQQEGTLPESPAEPFHAHGESGVASAESFPTLNAAPASVTASGGDPHTQAAGPSAPGQPDGVAAPGGATREALAADDLSATQTVPARRLGEYELLDKLGQGGMGAVYRARHVKLKRLEAVKILPSGRLEDPRAVARFEREMEAVGRLNHPHIVQAHDAREIGGTHFLVMEYVEGIDLQELVRRCGPLPVADACELVRQAAVGLQYAHEHGLVHRDIKPSNLMLQCSPVSPKPDMAGFGETRLHSEPVVKILDLGLALLTAGEPGTAEMTGSGQAMGTADYMAPEQVTDSHHVDIRADIYSLGCTLYKLLTGHAPFAGAQYAGGYQKMAAHLHEPCQPARQSRPDVPEALEQVLARMMAKQPADRFATPRELAEALRPFTAGCDLRRLAAQAHGRTAPGQPLAAATDARAETDPRRPSVARSPRDRRRITVAIALLLVPLLALALGIVFYLRDGQQTVKVELDGTLAADATVTVWLDGRQMEIKGVGETIKLKPGEHGYEIRRGDQIITTREFTVLKGDNPVLKISIEGTPVAAKPAGTPPTASTSPGAVNYELAFDGESSYVETPVKYDGSHPLTLEAWVTIGEVGKWMQLACNYDDARGIEIGLTSDRWWCFGMQRSEKGPPSFSKAIAPSGRHHVAVVFEANQPSLFVDGLHALSERFSDKDKYEPSTQPFTIGAETSKSARGNFFSGNIKEVRISRVARYHADFTPQERLEPDEHAMALYHFDEGHGYIAHDASGNGNDAKIVGAEWVEVGHKAPLPGIVARQAQIPDLGRWQVATVRPNESVKSLAWSPDGALIACGTVAGLVRIHDAHTLAPVCLFPAHRGEVSCLAWSPDGTCLATTSKEDYRVCFWKKDGRPKATFRMGSSVCVAWSPDSTQVASSGYGRDVRLYAVDGTVGPVLSGHTESVWSVAWRPDGKQIASASKDGTVRLWEADGKPGPILKGHDAEVLSAAWRPDGQQLASGDAHGEIHLWTATGDPGRVFKDPTGAVQTVAWSPDGTKISSRSDYTLRIWSAAGEGDPIVMKPDGGGLYSAVWSPDGEQVASAGQSGVVRVWRNDGTLERRLGGQWSEVPAVKWCAVTERIALASYGGVRMWGADGTPDRVLPADVGLVTSIACSPDGQRIAAGNQSSTVLVWKNDGSLVQTLKGHKDALSALAWNPDGQRLASASFDQTIRLWQADGTPGPVLDAPRVCSLAWHPDGTQFASAGLDSMVQFWQADGTQGTVIEAAQQTIGAIAWSPTGAWLATSGDPTVKLWHRDGKPGPVLKGHTRGVAAVAWSPDGHLLASGSGDTTVRLWSSDGTPRAVLRGHLGTVTALTWAGDGKLVSGDAGGTVRMWNVETGQAEWTAICLKDNRHVTFGPTGEILYGHPKVIEEELIYLLEPPDGPIELLKPSEFKKRAGR